MNAQQIRDLLPNRRTIALNLVVFLALAASVLIGQEAATDFTHLLRALPVRPTADFYQPPSVFYSNFTLLTTSIWLAYLLATCRLGYAAIQLFRRNDSNGGPALFLVGFVAGYPIVIFLNRIVSLCLQHALAPQVSLALVILAAVMLGAASFPPQSTLTVRRSPLSLSGETAVTMLLVAFLAIASLALGSGFVTGDGTAFFLSYFESALDDPKVDQQHFPVFAQHYDEAMYLYPMIFLSPATKAGGIIGYYWLMYAVYKAALVLTVYKSVRLLATPVFALLLTSLLFLGRQTLTQSHLMLFDSLNPLLYSLHPSRVLLAVVPLIVFAAMTTPEKGACKHTIFRVLTAAVFGAGLSSLPINIIATAGAALVGALAVGFIREEVGLRQYIDRIRPALCYAAILMLPPLFFAYSSHSSSGAFYITGVVVLISLVLCLPIFRKLGRLHVYIASQSGTLVVLGAFALSFLVAALLFGNLPVTRFRLYELWASPLLSTGKITTFSFGANPFVNLHWGFVFHHLTGFAGFLQSFGVPLLLCTICFAGVGGSLFAVRTDEGSRSFIALAIFVVFLLANLIVYDFFSRAYDWLDVWLKSRLIEPWFYSATASALLFLYAEAKQRQCHHVLGFWLFALGLSPVLFDPEISIFMQCWYNLQYLFS